MTEIQLIRRETPNNRLTVQRKIAAVSILPSVNIHAEFVCSNTITISHRREVYGILTITLVVPFD